MSKEDKGVGEKGTPPPPVVLRNKPDGQSCLSTAVGGVTRRGVGDGQAFLGVLASARRGGED